MSENKRTNADCAIARDLLPLYVEGMTSEGSNEFVKEHLSRCRECRLEAEKLNAPQLPADDPAVPMKRLRQTLLRRRLALTVLAVGLVCVLVFTAYARLTKRHYLRSSEAVAYCEGDRGELRFVFTDSVTGFERTEELCDGTIHHNVQAWYTLLDRVRGAHRPDGVSVRYTVVRPMGTPASGNGGSFDAGPADGPSPGEAYDSFFSEIRDDGPFGDSISLYGGRTELRYSIAPSASLLPLYFPIAASLLAVLLLLSAGALFLLKKREAARFALRMLLLTLACAISYLLTNGLQLWSHTPARDLLLSCILAALIIGFACAAFAVMPRRSARF